MKCKKFITKTRGLERLVNTRGNLVWTIFKGGNISEKVQLTGSGCSKVLLSGRAWAGESFRSEGC